MIDVKEIIWSLASVLRLMDKESSSKRSIAKKGHLKEVDWLFFIEITI
jgi:hypothetical protein